MTLPTFLFVAEALRLEEGVGFHVETPGVSRAPVPSPADNKARNDQAMAAFQAMMGGVQKRGRRR
jgi:hypothetical protein